VVDEQQLIQGAQHGERQAFAALVERYWDRLYRWLYHLTHDAHTAEDLTQESLMKAYRGLASFQPGSNFQAWLFRIAHNTLANHRRANRRVRQSFPSEVVSRQAEPAEQAMSREAFQQLARAVGRLPQDYRAAYLLRIEDELSFRDIAQAQNISEETARWRVFKARKKIMETMAPYLDREP
jgi:RNA polymerase sigma-70 factor (ECF subfamily)